MYLIQEHNWPGLAYEYRARQGAAWQRLLHGEYEGAAALFQEAYRVLLTNQPEGSRYHKGEALHNWGLALLYLGQTQAGARETLAAFIEDSASLAEENPMYEELGRPAALNLVYAFGVSGVGLAGLAREVRAHISSGGRLPDPHEYLMSPTVVALLATMVPTSTTRIIGRLRTAPERAVFVGGGYIYVDSHLRPMRDVVDGLGYEGIVPADHDMPPGWRSDHVSLTLLSMCEFAIFDGTVAAGQQVEVAFLLDRHRRPERTLILYDGDLTSRVQLSGGMNLEMLEANGIHPREYHGIAEAGQIIRDWLPPLPAPATTSGTT